MVLAITEFVYGGKHVTLPFLIGPKLLGDNATAVPQGMLYRRTRVAGSTRSVAAALSPQSSSVKFSDVTMHEHY